MVLSATGQQMYTCLQKGSDHLRIFDISEPAAPDLISETPLFDTEGARLRGIGKLPSNVGFRG